MNELKQVIQKTTKVTKVGRNEIVERAEDETQEVAMPTEDNAGDSEDDGEEEEKSVDLVMDTDGN